LIAAATLLIEQPTKFKLVINLKTATHSPSRFPPLPRANEVMQRLW